MSTNAAPPHSPPLLASPSHPLPPAPALFQELARDDIFRVETARLWLRWPLLSDAAAMTRQAGSHAVAEMTAMIPHPYPKDLAETAMFNARKGNAVGDKLSLAITRKNRPRELIGMIGARPGDTGMPVFGYWLGHEHWGHGYATEASHAMIDAVFTMTSASGLDANARVINPASRGVLEKCGFRHLGSRLMAMSARGGHYPCDEFRLERKTWAALRNWAAPSWAIPLLDERASRAAGGGRAVDDRGVREALVMPVIKDGHGQDRSVSPSPA